MFLETPQSPAWALPAGSSVRAPGCLIPHSSPPHTHTPEQSFITAVCLLLREVYRVTESLQREKSGLLKQLDFLRWVSAVCVLRAYPRCLRWGPG